jgi:hypothetical protein
MNSLAIQVIDGEVYVDRTWVGDVEPHEMGGWAAWTPGRMTGAGFDSKDDAVAWLVSTFEEVAR